jgi:hypothetical protein
VCVPETGAPDRAEQKLVVHVFAIEHMVGYFPALEI